jgi:membrane associated rhomboid family serine protease
MDPNTYLIIHLTGIAALALGLGGMMAGGAHRKAFAILQGLALVVMLVSGFGLLAKLHLGFPHFAMVKLGLWVVIAMLPMIFRRLRVPLVPALCVFIALVGVMAWLGVVKPQLW